MRYLITGRDKLCLVDGIVSMRSGFLYNKDGFMEQFICDAHNDYEVKDKFLYALSPATIESEEPPYARAESGGKSPGITTNTVVFIGEKIRMFRRSYLNPVDDKDIVLVDAQPYYPQSGQAKLTYNGIVFNKGVFTNDIYLVGVGSAISLCHVNIAYKTAMTTYDEFSIESYGGLMIYKPENLFRDYPNSSPPYFVYINDDAPDHKFVLTDRSYII